MIRHGERRNGPLKAYEPIDLTVDILGEPIRLPFVPLSWTTERWCEVCGKWVTASGAIGDLQCIECGMHWWAYGTGESQ